MALTRMTAHDHSTQVGHLNTSVGLSCGRTLVPKHDLQMSKTGPSTEHMGRARMAQYVGCDAFFQADFLGPAVKHFGQ